MLGSDAMAPCTQSMRKSTEILLAMLMQNTFTTYIVPFSMVQISTSADDAMMYHLRYGVIFFNDTLVNPPMGGSMSLYDKSERVLRVSVGWPTFTSG